MTKNEIWNQFKFYEKDKCPICNKCKNNIKNEYRIMFLIKNKNDKKIDNYQFYNLCEKCFIGEDDD